MTDIDEIKPVETMAEAVEQGAELLDKYRPGWENTVSGAMSDGLFDMSQWHSCMVGTLELFKVRGKHTSHGGDEDYISFNGLSFLADDPEARYVGFLPIDDDDHDDDWAFDALDSLWREQVRLRTPESASS